MPQNRKRRLPLVRESEASGRTLEIYQEIKTALGVPHVNLVFQAYGAQPRFLDVMWRSWRPVLEAGEFFREADRLRAEAYTRVHNYFLVPDLAAKIREIQFTPGAQHELAEVVELFHYNNPPLLLIAAGQLQAFEDDGAHAHRAKAPAEHPVFAEKPVKVTEDDAPAPIRKIYEEMKRVLGVSFINTDYQALARFPDYLNLYWESLKPVVLSPLYIETQRAMRESALALASELPDAPQLSLEGIQEAGLQYEEINAAIRVTEDFLELLSGLVLNIAFAKISIEGGNQRQSPDHRPPQAELAGQEENPPERAA